MMLSFIHPNLNPPHLIYWLLLIAVQLFLHGFHGDSLRQCFCYVASYITVMIFRVMLHIQWSVYRSRKKGVFVCAILYYYMYKIALWHYDLVAVVWLKSFFFFCKCTINRKTFIVCYLLVISGCLLDFNTFVDIAQYYQKFSSIVFFCCCFFSSSIYI